MRPSFVLACLLLVGTAPGDDALAQAPANPTINPEFQDQVAMLNEFSERRRVNVFFPNEQTVFHGVPVGFVNVGRGNFSFVRRDLVTAGRLPVIVARVYDSAWEGPTDFSPGWRLALAETIEARPDGSLRYVDESGSVLRFETSGDGFVLVPAQPSDIVRLQATADGFELALRHGWRKRFRNLGGLARLTEVRDANGNAITLHYDASHRLQRIAGQNGHAVDFIRDGQSRITRIEDELGRHVLYAYGGNGQLSTVTDLGGNDWTHQYANQRLHQVLDPLGNEAAWVSYDPEGRARQTRLYQDQYQYRYQGPVTEVRDAAGNTSTYTHNAAGITTRVVNAQGYASELELDGHNRVTGLHHQGAPRARYEYDEQGHLAHVQRFEGADEVQYAHAFDAQGRLLEVTGSDGRYSRFEYDSRGNLTERDDDGVITSYTYNAHGDRVRQESEGTITDFAYNADGLLTGLQSGTEQTSLDYDAAGRLTAVEFPGGNTHEYSYDDLGLRTRTTRNDGGHKYYRYDATGNLVRGGGTEHSGQYVSQALTLDDDNKVLQAEFANDSTLQLEYDAQGNPTLLDWGNRTLACSYDPQGRLVRIDDSSAGVSEYQYAPGEPDIRRQWDTRVGATLSEQRRASASLQNLPSVRYTRPAGTPWQGVTWNPALAQYDLPQEEGLVLPDALAQAAERRRHLLHTLASDPKMQAHFAMPSNSFFLPPEYVSVNCWLPGCWLTAGSISAPATVYTGQAFNMSVGVSSFGPDCWARIFDWYIDNEWVGGDISAALNNTISQDVDSPGNKILKAIISCICDSSPIVRTKTILVNQNPCAGQALDQTAYAWLAPITLEAREFGTSFYCSNNQLFARETRQSADSDRCTFDPYEPTTDKGWAHTHPFFIYSAQSQIILNCDGSDIHLNNFAEVSSANDGGIFWSQEDKDRSSEEYPGYLKNTANVLSKCPGSC